MSDSSSDTEIVELSVHDWIITEVIQTCLDEADLLIRFRLYVDRFTRRRYMKYRLTHWKNGWNRFLRYIETQEFEVEIVKYLYKKGFSLEKIMSIFKEYREEFFQLVRDTGEKNITDNYTSTTKN